MTGTKEAGKRGLRHGRDLLALLVFAIVLALVVLLVSSLNDTGSKQETAIVRDAVRQAAVTCYAVEGAYPDSLNYLREHYGLAYDEEKYLVVYDVFASNIVPDIRVLEIGVQ